MSIGGAIDTPEVRKARGAFFTPGEVTEFMCAWAIRDESDRVLEPSTGDAAFLVSAVRRLRGLSGDRSTSPVVDGVEIHEPSAQTARERVRAAGGEARIRVSDFFTVRATPTYDAVVGNPPYIRFQDFAGESRLRARAAALKGGVALTGLASSWAAFVIHSALFLRDGGRLALVLPAELLSVNYASPIRSFLLESFENVELVLFEEQVFPQAEADVVLLLADGFRLGPTSHAIIRQARNAADLSVLGVGEPWAPRDPADKWTGSLVPAITIDRLRELAEGGSFTSLDEWGDTTLGIVTGNNSYFCLSPERAGDLGIDDDELLRLSPPGSGHLRGLELSVEQLDELGRQGKSTRLFYPSETPSRRADQYIEAGSRTGVDLAYKCRVRRVWYRVPIVAPADLLLTYMNADTPRLVANEARAHHLNSVHGVYLKSARRQIGCELLPLASLNSVTMMSAELVGRAYGGGILKLEPKEADQWMMPSLSLVEERAGALRAIKGDVASALDRGDLAGAVTAVDRVLLSDSGVLSGAGVDAARAAYETLARRRKVRGTSGR